MSSKLATLQALALTLLLSIGTVSGQRRCCAVNTASTETACRFNRSSSSFAGTPLEQARCLLRRVKIRGDLDLALERLPVPLEELVGKPVSVEREKLRRYLSTQVIPEAEVGGDLNKPLSPADSAAPQGERARYFVIHDTSTPNYLNSFPSNINEQSWSQNSFRKVNPNLTHVYVNRMGKSKTVVNFESVLPPTNFGTKFSCCLGERTKGLFIHIELLQPRHCDSSVGRCTMSSVQSNLASRTSNDNISPNPGFTEAQVDRLALLYVVASVRKGEWLIPAFHAPIDATLKNAHDDPQNFDLAQWASSLGRLLAELQARD